ICKWWLVASKRRYINCLNSALTSTESNLPAVPHRSHQSRKMTWQALDARTMQFYTGDKSRYGSTVMMTLSENSDRKFRLLHQMLMGSLFWRFMKRRGEIFIK